ncbi:hypothetical protein [Kozakia baliensis]|uniref:hypothetical protein n=1 Tax=Kozakia baliensis TaxID=153496 RepID=UPI00116F75CD|nr:hypothetical protein [Kozakia baliensis]GBR34365.1 hypothetical protein AA0488_2854 [Kozakia baliensis NRIC 0488]GEL65444.1 hypothetical protein KBA01_27300 [Kozakia baliensis]
MTYKKEKNIKNPIDIQKGILIPGIRNIVGKKDFVISRFGPIFRSPMNMETQDYLDFLSFKHNCHWSGLERRGKEAIDGGLDHLREMISVLTNESRPLSERFDTCLEALHGVGHGTLSAMLLVAFPDRYGVWNNISEIEMRMRNLWPTFNPKSSQGEKYAAINDVLLGLADDLKTDLWTLDALWWAERLGGDENGRYYDSWKISILQMVENALCAGKYSNGQKVATTLKNKDVNFSSTIELEKYVQKLLEENNYHCAITDLELHPKGGDPQLHPSLDRIDSNGHYEVGNLQVVARFINQWKSSTPDAEFRRLIALVRDEQRFP